MREIRSARARRPDSARAERAWDVLKWWTVIGLVLALPGCNLLNPRQVIEVTVLPSHDCWPCSFPFVTIGASLRGPGGPYRLVWDGRLREEIDGGDCDEMEVAVWARPEGENSFIADSFRLDDCGAYEVTVVVRGSTADLIFADIRPIDG